MDTVEVLLREKGREVVSASPGASVLELARLMNERRIGSVLILEGTTLVGIVTERDLLTKVVAQGRDPAALRVREIMTTDVVVVEAGTPVGQAMRTMNERRCRHLPVMRGREVAGIISIGDCNRWYSRDQEYTVRHLTDYIQGNYR